MPTISTLTYFPIKACKGRDVEATLVERCGLQDDRRLMLVGAQGNFLSQRDFPRLALVAPGIRRNSLQLSAPGMPGTDIPIRHTGFLMEVSIWDSCGIRAVDQGNEAAAWFSTYLGMPVRLVGMSQDFKRPLSPEYAIQPDDYVSFADGFPVLIASEESLDELNSRLDIPLPMNRFRPNIVVSGCEPFAEDTWKRIRIGEVDLAVVKPCARCKVTTVDQETAIQAKEPLKTLATFRCKEGNKVMFGMNAIPIAVGRVRVGDVVEILE